MDDQTRDPGPGLTGLPRFLNLIQAPTWRSVDPAEVRGSGGAVNRSLPAAPSLTGCQIKLDRHNAPRPRPSLKVPPRRESCHWRRPWLPLMDGTIMGGSLELHD